MKFIQFGLIITLLLTTGLAMAFDWEDGALNVDFTSEGYYQDIHGNKANSVLEEGWMHREDLIVDTNQHIGKKVKFQGYAHTRASNDPQHQINERDVMFVEGYGRIADDYSPDIYEVWVGDFAEDDSPYTMNTALLGAKAFYKPTDWMKIAALFGQNRDKSLDGYARYSAGGKVVFNHRDHLIFGATLLNTEVDRGSIGGDASIGDQYNCVWAGDLQWKLFTESLQFDIAYARSVYNDDRRDNTLNDEYGNAVLVEAEYQALKDLIFSAAFERVEAWFNSVLGSASPDLQRVMGQVDYSPSRVISSITLLHEYSFNQLSARSLEDFRTYTHATAFSATIAPFYNRNDSWNSFNVNLQMDHNRNKSNDHPMTLDQDDLSTGLSFSQSFDHWDYSIGYTYTKFWDRVESINEIKGHNPVVSVGVQFPLWVLDSTWNINGGYEYRKYINSGLVDRIYSADSQLSLSYEKTKSTLILAAAVEYADNAPGDELDTPDNTGFLYNAIFEQVLSEKETFSANLTLGISYMDYEEDAAGEDYDETVYQLKLNIKF